MKRVRVHSIALVVLSIVACSPSPEERATVVVDRFFDELRACDLRAAGNRLSDEVVVAAAEDEVVEPWGPTWAIEHLVLYMQEFCDYAGETPPITFEVERVEVGEAEVRVVGEILDGPTVAYTGHFTLREEAGVYRIRALGNVRDPDGSARIDADPSMAEERDEMLRENIRNLITEQRLHFAEHGTWAERLDQTPFVPWDSSAVRIVEATDSGWSAVSEWPGTDQRCAIYWGNAAPLPPARRPNTLTCTDPSTR